MQILKEHLRERILSEAEDAFFSQGYALTNLRGIAKACGITVGNLYRYYESKEALLDAVLKPLLDEVDVLLDVFLDSPHLDDLQQHGLFHLVVAERLSALCERHPKTVRLLITGTRGTKYEAYFLALIHRVAKGIRETVERDRPTVALKPVLYEVLAKNHVEGIMYIIEHVSDLEEQKETIRLFLDVHLFYFERYNQEQPLMASTKKGETER